MAHIKGNQNIVADCLSRPTNAVLVDACDLTEIAKIQDGDEETKSNANKLSEFKLKNDLQILCDTSTPVPSPFVPASVRQSVFDSLHGISHTGVKATLKAIKSRYYWPDMDRSIRKRCNECMSCQQSKVNKHTRSPVTNFILPSGRFETVHLDIVGPLPAIRNPNEMSFSPLKYLLTCIDRTTRWIEAIPMSNISASTVAHSFISGWISRFGVPLHVITDRGTQFESELFNELSKVVGFHRLRTTAYHPQTNGMIERSHRTIKTAITSRKESWLTALPVVLMGIRGTPNESEYSPFNAVTGASMLLPQQFINADNSNQFNNDDIRKLAVEMSKIDVDVLSAGRIHSKKRVFMPPELLTCQRVWLRTDRIKRPLEAPYSGPYKIIKRQDKHYTIEILNGSQISVSIDRLKPVVESTTRKQPSPEPSTEDEVGEEPLRNEKLNEPSLRQTRSGRKVRFNRRSDCIYY